MVIEWVTQHAVLNHPVGRMFFVVRCGETEDDRPWDGSSLMEVRVLVARPFSRAFPWVGLESTDAWGY